ncbi:YihY/virulence factor BrkB family protein [Jatrophihabitans telluris]|uniref:YihY/virulence factor BrkB family protein n=1 Tax=Jatrophihabitans telluris TaxID=2038343 RepID=A0ABY4QTQ0_9ACTN|nr:YhjD/YihY/BrkB family envelope integrity protein [Jatrophihabitans telluris]UQX86714.1 YihY/virulence factor BrkB family protein [Jatrophihabitans telluris]
MISQRRAMGLLRRTVTKAWHDRVLGLSAEAAFWQLLSLPSLFLALLAALGYFSDWLGADTVDRIQTNLLRGFSRAFSDEVVNQLVAPLVHQVLNEGRADILSVSFLLALWAGSSATATFVNTITIAYGMRDLRGAVRSRLLALGIYLGSIVIGVVALPALVLGPTELVRLFPPARRGTADRLINDAYWPAVIALLLLGLTSLYHLAPPRRLPWRRGFPGAVLAMVIFLLGSAGLREYIAFIVAHNHAYGTLAAPIAALLFFFLLALGVLLGAEFNAAIEQMSPTASRHPERDRRWKSLTEPGSDATEGQEPPELPGIDS